MSSVAPDSSPLSSETEMEPGESGFVTEADGHRDRPHREVFAGTDPQHAEETESPPVLFLIDALSIVYRSYYALQNRPLFSSNGINTSAIYGFTQTILSLLQRYNPDAMAVVFDSHTTEPGPGSFRQKLFPNYKANRERMPDGVRDALPYVKRILHQLGIQSFELDSYEADDVIGTLATEANHVGYQVVIISSDKDFRQLLKPDWLRILRPARSGTGTSFEEVTEARLAVECGAPIRPTQYADVLALAGDSIDNIPGVPGIGPKTAARLIFQLHSIENLLCNLDAVQPERLREKIIAKADEILRNKILVKIQTNVPLNALRPDLNDSDEIDSAWPDDRRESDIDWLSCCRRRPWNVHDLVALLRELDMDALTRRVQYLARFHGQGRLEKHTNDEYGTVPRTSLASAALLTTSWNDAQATSGSVASAELAETGASGLSAGCHLVDSEGGASTIRPAVGPAPVAAATALVGRSVASIESQSTNAPATKHCDPSQVAASSMQSDLITNELVALVGAPPRYQFLEASNLDAVLAAHPKLESIGLFIMNAGTPKKRRSRRRGRDATAPGQAPSAGTDLAPGIASSSASSSVEEVQAACLGLALEQGVAIGMTLPSASEAPAFWAKMFRERLEVASLTKVGFDLKRILKTLLAHIDVGHVSNVGPWIDPAVAHALLHPDEAFERPDLLSKRYLGELGAALWSQYVDALNRTSESKPSTEVFALAAAAQADLALRILDRQVPRLDAIGMRHLAFQVEFPLTLVLADMERIGVYVDRAQLNELAVQMEHELMNIESQIYALTGKPFNLRSAEQLAKVLFEELGAPAPVRTPAGKASTSDRVLAALARLNVSKKRKDSASSDRTAEESTPKPGELDDSPLNKAARIAALAQEYRQVSKLLSTYVRGLETHIDSKTQRIHATFHQTGAITGRLSSSSPNLQAIPIRSVRGRALRAVFRAAPSYERASASTDGSRRVLISADYEQIELRIIAALSGDAVLVQAFRDEVDVHAETAIRLFGLARGDRVNNVQRSYAKAINYGIPYGVSAFGLAQNLGLSVQEARTLIRDYNAAFPGIALLKRELIERARAVGYASTLLGRRRYLPALHSSNYSERAAAERAAVNMPIQGSQADMIKVAMVRIWERLRSMALQTRLVIQVHDELVFEAPESELDLVLPVIREEMERALPLPNDIPVKVRLGYGESWMTAHAA